MGHQRGNTLYGLEDPSLLHSPPSNRCGSENKNTTNLAHPLSTENASKKCNSPPQTFLLLIISSLAVIFRSLLFHIIHICAFYFVFEIVYTPVLPSHTLSLSLFCVSLV